MSWVDNKKAIQEAAESFDPAIKVLTKDNWFSATLAWLLFLVSFGRIKKEIFLENYATTICNYHFYPAHWGYANVLSLLSHEARHTQQFRFFGFGLHPLVGLPIGAFVYLLFPLPILLCWGRFYSELDADRYSYRFKIRRLRYMARDIRRLAEHKAGLVSGSAYLYSWPKSWTLKAYQKMAEEVIDEFEEEQRK